MPYTLPAPAARPEPAERTAYLVASGDLRESANVAGWPTQVELERVVGEALAEHGWTVQRANEVDRGPATGSSPASGWVSRSSRAIPSDAPLIVAEAIWQYSHHVLAGLRTHEGPILTVANFAGRWPGLVGLLGLNAGLTKMGREYSTIWTVDFTDAWFQDGHRGLARDRPHRARRQPRPRPAPAAGQRGARPRRGAGRTAPGREGDHRRLRRGLHGDVQRDLRRRAAEPARASTRSG